MQLRDHFFRILPRQHKGLAIDRRRLLDDAGIREHHENVPGAPSAGLSQQVRHHRGGLARAHRTVTGKKGTAALSIPTSLIHFPAELTAGILPAQLGHIPIQRSQPLLRSKLRQTRSFRCLTVCGRSVCMIRISQTRQHHPKEHSLVAIILPLRCAALRGHQRSMPLEQLLQRGIDAFLHCRVFVAEYRASPDTLLRHVWQTLMVGIHRKGSAKSPFLFQGGAACVHMVGLQMMLLLRFPSQHLLILFRQFPQIMEGSTLPDDVYQLPVAAHCILFCFPGVLHRSGRYAPDMVGIRLPGTASFCAMR